MSELVDLVASERLAFEWLLAAIGVMFASAVSALLLVQHCVRAGEVPVVQARVIAVLSSQ